MIQMLNTKTIGGQIYPAGSVVSLNSAIEAQLIASADAARTVLPALVAQAYAGWSRDSTNSASDTSWVTLANVTVPAGTMGLNSKLVIISDYDYTSSAVQKYPGVDWGGLNFAGPTVSASGGAKYLYEIANANSLAIQKILNSTSYGGTSGGHDTYAVDTTYDAAITFKCKWAAPAASERITLLGYSIWHYPGS
ncbi:hypothetical protein [Nitrosovibrio tenuis]|uniref:Uncharacterized protein n=1 Tax=Nitrosovibrio tenuis TaxID=1233 RepID=A0A1H7IQZ2_9PROT|nr:hypothetical protein [Nitrosovibrio tenuis]SEK64137.1 hypothetical protein SAMN05216387_102247 [Nitrosovibrio tenuis]